MTIKAPFNPSYTSGQIVAPAAAAASVSINAEAKSVCLSNLGGFVCYVRVSNAAVSATTADYPVMPGVQVVISKGDGENVLSHISAAGTSLHIMTGEGF